MKYFVSYLLVSNISFLSILKSLVILNLLSIIILICKSKLTLNISCLICIYSQTCLQRPALGPQNCGLCRQVVVVHRLSYLIKIEICSLKLGLLYTGGRYSEVAVRSGLTVCSFLRIILFARVQVFEYI